MNMNEARTIAKKVMEKAKEAEERVAKLRKDAEDLLVWIGSTVKEVAGEMPKEDDFLRVVACLADEAIKFPFPLEMIDDTLFYKALVIVDKYVLDKLVGEDWYKKVQDAVNKLSIK